MRGFCHCGEKTCNIALFLFALYLEIWRGGFGRQCTVDLKQGMTSLVMHGMTGEGNTPSLLDVSIKQENILSLLQISTTLAFLSNTQDPFTILLKMIKHDITKIFTFPPCRPSALAQGRLGVIAAHVGNVDELRRVRVEPWRSA